MHRKAVGPDLPNHNECYGCGACGAVCPSGAINVSPGDLGFLVPHIDNELCIRCGKCEKVCPVLNSPALEPVDKIPPFAVWSKSPRVRRLSSSGGAAPSIAGDFLARGYGVSGAVFDSDFRSVKHILVETVEDLFETIGSKYIQSNSSSAMRHIAGFDGTSCDKLRKHVFFGTPCQVAGLSKLLNSGFKGLPGRGSSDVLLVDFFCHGVPSYLAWQAFLDEIVIPKTGRLQYVNFRDKSFGWTNYSLVCQGTKGTYAGEFGFTLFGQLFLSDLCLRESCYTCPFRNRSAADLRLGDFWGQEFDKDKMGVSLAAPITQKGLSALEENRNLILRSVPVSLLYQSQPLMLSSLPMPSARKNVMSKLEQGTALNEIFVEHLKSDFNKRIFKRRIGKLLPPGIKKALKFIARG